MTVRSQCRSYHGRLSRLSGFRTNEIHQESASKRTCETCAREEAQRLKKVFQHWCRQRGLTLAAELIEQDWDRMVTFYLLSKEAVAASANHQSSGVTVCRSSAANGRGQAIQESGKRPGGDLEDAAGGGAAIRRRLKAPELMKDVYQGAKYVNGVPVNQVPEEKAA